MRDAGCKGPCSGVARRTRLPPGLRAGHSPPALEGHKGRPEVLGQGAGTVSSGRKENCGLPSSGGDGGIHPVCGRGVQTLTAPWLSQL